MFLAFRFFELFTHVDFFVLLQAAHAKAAKTASFNPTFSSQSGMTTCFDSEFSSLGSLPMHPSTMEQGPGVFGFDESLTPKCSGLHPQNLFQRSPSPPSSSSTSSSSGMTDFAQQSVNIEAHRRAAWEVFWRRVFKARTDYLSDVALLHDHDAGILAVDPSLMF